MHSIFSKKFGLINYSGGNYNPLVLLQSPSEELRVFHKYDLVNCPSSPSGKSQLLSSEAEAPGLPGMGPQVLWRQAPGLPAAVYGTAFARGTEAKGILVPRFQASKLCRSSKITALSQALLQAIPTGLRIFQVLQILSLLDLNQNIESELHVFR